MAFEPRYQGRAFIADTATFDVGLRRHMVTVYNIMMIGLVVSGLVAYATAHSPFMMNAMYQVGGDGGVHYKPLGLVAPFLPFVFLIVLQLGIRNLSLVASQAVFMLFSASMGLSLSSIFMDYTGHSIAEIFFVSASMFAATSLYGYTTKSDLTRMGSFFVMALFGLIAGMLVNMFLHSSALDYLLTIAGVILFTGLTAFDTQAIRNSYSESYGVESNGKLAIQGALRLYLDFINLFMSMLRLFGNRR